MDSKLFREKPSPTPRPKRGGVSHGLSDCTCYGSNGWFPLGLQIVKKGRPQTRFTHVARDLLCRDTHSCKLKFRAPRVQVSGSAHLVPAAILAEPRADHVPASPAAMGSNLNVCASKECARLVHDHDDEYQIMEVACVVDVENHRISPWAQYQDPQSWWSISPQIKAPEAYVADAPDTTLIIDSTSMEQRRR